MDTEKKDDVNEKLVPFEEAINQTGFGLYNFLMTGLCGLNIVSFVFVVYNPSILVPASACELQTTGAQQGLLAAGPVVGAILGSFGWGYLGDTRGRRFSLFIALTSSATVNAVASISPNWIVLMILQFITSILAAGQYTLSMTLLGESAPMERRNLVLLMVSSIFLLSQGLMAVVAIPVIPLRFSYELSGIGIYWNSWRTLLLIYSIPSLLCVCGLLLMEESPKFVFSQGDDEGALRILEKMHRINKGKRANGLQIVGLVREQPAATEGVTKSALQSLKDQSVPLFKKPLLKYTLIIASLCILQQVGAFMVWLPTIANRFMEALQQDDMLQMTLCELLDTDIEVVPDPDAVPCALNETALLIVFGVGALQSIVNAILSLFINRVGRRNMVMAIAVLAGGCGVVVNLVPHVIGGVALLVLFLLGILVLGLYTAITVALFPTHLRAMAVALTVMAGRMGTFVFIQLVNYLLVANCTLAFYLFCSLFMTSALVAALLPDDRYLGKPPAVPKESQTDTRL